MRVNFCNCTIEMSAKEMKKAEHPYSKEYKELLMVMRDLPHFNVVIKHSHITHNTNRGLTYEAMMQYIMQNAPEKMDEFETIQKHGSYPATSKWFRLAFPEFSCEVHFCTSTHMAA